MSYTKITIGGKERGLKFNQMAMMILTEKTDKDHPMATAAYALIYAGLKANCYVKQEEADFTFAEVCEWVESVSGEDMALVNAAFMETEAYKNGQAYIKEQAKVSELPKKKSRKKSIEQSA